MWPLGNVQRYILPHNNYILFWNTVWEYLTCAFWIGSDTQFSRNYVIDIHRGCLRHPRTDFRSLPALTIYIYTYLYIYTTGNSIKSTGKIRCTWMLGGCVGFLISTRTKLIYILLYSITNKIKNNIFKFFIDDVKIYLNHYKIGSLYSGSSCQFSWSKTKPKIPPGPNHVRCNTCISPHR